MVQENMVEVIETRPIYTRYILERDEEHTMICDDCMRVGVFDESKSKKVRLYEDFTGKIIVKCPSSSVIYYTLKDGVLHSYNDEPAVLYNDDEKLWYDNGVLSRLTGPANSWCDDNGNQFVDFFVNGEAKPIGEFLRMCDMTDEEKLELVMLYG